MGNLRIAIAGCQHETNTFAPMTAPFEEFVKADAWPGLTKGDDLFETMAGKNLPLAGFVDAAGGGDVQLCPILWCSAEPSSYVSQDAFDRIVRMICDGLRAYAPLDAVYLDLHGAMVTEECEDGEGELLHRVRGVIGHDTPLIASLDLHANVTERMIALADGFSVFRTYPHVDMADTGRRAFELLQRYMGLDRGNMHKAFRKLPFLIPLSAQCTTFEPCKDIYALLPTLENDDVWSMDFAAGFPPADIHECGPAVVCYGCDADQVERAAERLYRFALNAETRLDNALLTPDQAIGQAMATTTGKPVVLADVQDNPGAGGSSDTIGLLEALIRNRATGAVLAIINDPGAARAAMSAGVDRMIEIDLGGKSGQPGQAPYHGRFKVENTTDGCFLCTGAMYRGMQANIGPMALLRVGDEDCDVRVIVSSERMQCLDLSIFRHMGIEPERQNILAIKSTVHFRADFDPIAAATLLVEAPGAHPCRLLNVPYRNLRPGVRLEPMGPVHMARQV